MAAMVRRLQVVDEGDSSTLLQVAFATADRETVDQHFGSAKSFVIYGVNFDDAKLLSITEFGQLNQDGNEDKLMEKLAVLEGCIAVYCRACGASAVRQLLAAGIQPVKVSEGMVIEDLIDALQQELRHGPSTWLAKAIRNQSGAASGRFDAMESEGWLD